MDEGGRLAARPRNGVQRAAAVAAAKRDLVQEGHKKSTAPLKLFSGFGPRCMSHLLHCSGTATRGLAKNRRGDVSRGIAGAYPAGREDNGGLDSGGHRGVACERPALRNRTPAGVLPPRDTAFP